MTTLTNFCCAETVDDIKRCIDNYGLPNEEQQALIVNYHCYCGNMDIVKYFVEIHDFDVNAANTGFEYVCEYGYMDLFDYLVSKGINIVSGDAKCQQTVLFTAVRRNQLDIIIKLLPLMTREQINLSENGWTVVHIAAFKGYLDILKHLTIYGAELNVPNHRGDTSLTIAKRVGHKHIVEYLSDFWI